MYFVATGLAPLISMPRFEAVTWPKTDDWLVVMVGLLAVAVGVALLHLARGSKAADGWVLGVGTALGFAGMDAWLVTTGTGSPAYLVDLVVELGFVAVWSGARIRGERATDV